MVKKIKILVWNVHGIYDSYSQQQALFQISQDNKIDILILTEWSTQYRRYTQNIPNYKNPFKAFKYKYNIYNPTSDVAILINKNIKHKPVNLKYTNPFPEFKDNIHAIGIQVLNDIKPLTIFGFYNSNYNANSQKPYQLLNFIDQKLTENYICCGDLNIHHPILGDINTNIMGSTFIEDIQDEDIYIYNTDSPPTHKAGHILDVILGSYNQNRNIHNYLVHPKWETKYDIKSDHFPFTFTYQFDFSENNHKQYRSWNLNSNKWDEYQSLLEDRFSNFEWIDKDNIQVIWDNFEDLWKKYTNSTIGKKTIIEKPTPWWTFKIDRMQRMVKNASRFIQKKTALGTLSNSLKKQYRNLLAQKQNLIRKAKKRFNTLVNQIIQENSTSDSTFWKALNKFQGKGVFQLPNFYEDDPNRIITDDAQKLKAIHEIIKNPPQPKNPSRQDINHYRKIDEWYTNHFNKYTEDPNHNHQYIPYQLNHFVHEKNTHNILNILNRPITIQELNNQIKKLDNSKSMGMDLLHNKMIMNTGQTFRRSLLKIFNLSFNTGIQPKQWTIDRITPIPKPNKNHTFPESYRPIAVSSTIGRLLQKIIAARIQTYCYKIGLFKYGQAGFQINRSCIDAILPLLQTILHNQDIDSLTSLLQCDFAKAYDTVWHNGLIYRLCSKKVGMKGKIIKWINNFLRNRFTTIAHNDITTDLHQQTIGLPQGSSLSPILYIIYTISYSLTLLGRKYINKGCFADDTIFWTKPCNKSFYENNMNTLLNMEYNNFRKWCTKWKLVIEPTKNIWTKFYPPKQIFSYQTQIQNQDNIQNLNNQIHKELQGNMVDYNILKVNKKKDLINNIRQININSLNLDLIKRDNPLINMEILDINQESFNNNINWKDNTRYLGIFLDKHMTFDIHFNKIIGSSFFNFCQMKAMILNKIPLKISTLLAIYYGKTRARFEFGMIIYSNKNKLDRIQKIQNMFLRLILNLPKSTPIPILHLLANIPTIEERYQLYMGNHFIQSYSATSNHPLNKYVNEYKIYTENINNIDLRLFQTKKSMIKDKDLQYNKFHPLNQAKEVLKKLNHPLIQMVNPSEIKQQPFTSLPIYITNYPKNIKYELKELDGDIKCNKDWNIFYSDGSAETNPGIGGACWSWVQHPKFEGPTIYHMWSSKVKLEINYYELYIIKEILRYLIKNPSTITKYIIIGTDSKNCIEWITQLSYPSYYTHYELIEEIYQLSNILYFKYKVKIIKLQKIKAHSISKYNQEVDERAKLAAKRVNPRNLKEKDQPLYINKQQLRQKIKTKAKDKWVNYKENKIQEAQALLDRPRYIIELFDEPSELLTIYIDNITNYKNRGIILGLITEETPTNYHLMKNNRQNHNNGICRHCNTLWEDYYEFETIYHIFYMCDEYHAYRTNFRNNLIKIEPLFKQDIIWFNIKNILFPFKNINFKSNITNLIWNEILSYTKNTKLPFF